MSLQPGIRLGQYEIQSALGAGGMGEVYKARDTKLGREVALKILPEEFSRDPDRIARFQREAQLLAALNHPNIAAIYGLEESNGSQFLVLELVEGGTLAHRLMSGPLPFDDALIVARQVADALQAAHEKGIIHRDLKPANIGFTDEGQVKVLDFGLAKAMEQSGLKSDAPDLTNSPTLSMAATRAGTILGTAAYMSPEQAKGRGADKRSDIWAFGCVLYEMLAGRKAFDGEDLSDTLAAVLRGEPEWSLLPATVPAHVRALLRRCLMRDRKARIADISVARFVLDEAATEFGLAAASNPIDASGLPTTAGPGVSSASRRRERIWMALAVLLAVTMAGGTGLLYLRADPPTQRPITFPLAAPDQTAFAVASVPTVSPDGTKITFTATNEGGNAQLWVRSLGSLTAQALASTDGATYPFWSPDSRFIGFFAAGKLRKIDVTAGPAQTICDATNGRGGTWNRDGVIVFAPTTTGPLFRVGATGGIPAALTKLDQSRAETSHRWPQFLPDGRRFLYWSNRGQQSEVLVSDLDGTSPKALLTTGSSAQYVSPGYLFFARESALMAQAFDAGRVELTGEPFRVADRVEENLNSVSLSGFSASADGTILANRIGSGNVSQMVWFDRSGKQLGTVGQPGAYSDPALSPDGTRLVIARADPQTNTDDLWTLDLARGIPSRLTFDPADDFNGVWSPDGTRVAFVSGRDGGLNNIYSKLATSSGTDELMLKTPNDKRVGDWSRDGRFLLFRETLPGERANYWVLPLAGERKAQPIENNQSMRQQFVTGSARVSPDGRWIAYNSSESGRSEVYVQPFPATGGKWRVSSNGGSQPMWRGDGREIFYRSGDDKIMAVQVNPRATFERGNPAALFQARFALPVGGSRNMFVVTDDGQRFLVVTAADEPTTPFVVTVNWLEGVKK